MQAAEDQGGTVLRTVSGGSDGAAVSASLAGLCSAVDELKQSMGMGEQVEFAAVEEFINRLRQENDEFRQFAEEAILSAQRMRDERDELQQRLDQSSLEKTMGAALAETQKLKDVADEFEKDLYQQKLAEAEARVAEVEGLRERIGELEEENAGLTQTLNEFRQTTHQLHRLQSHEVRRLQANERDGSAGGSGSRPAAPSSVAAAVAAVEAAEAAGAPHSRRASLSGGSSPRISSASGATPLRRVGRSPSNSPPGPALGTVPADLAAPSALGAEAVRVAEQLEEVSGGGDSGLLAAAAVALRTLSKRDAELVQQQQENRKLRTEVDELNDTMFSKTFKAPSAWAEREIKYKSERKFWEDQQKEVQARVVALSAEMEVYRGAGKAQELEGRIQELEAKLLQTEREKDVVRSQLHEMQLSMRMEGEFGNAGKRLSPYKGPLGAPPTGHEVQQLVDHLEHGHIGLESPEVIGASVAAERAQGLEAQLQQSAIENQQLRRQLHDQQLVSVPASLQGELGQVATAAAVLAAAAGLEARLHEAETESQSLRQQQSGSGADAGPAADMEEAAAVGAAAQAETLVQELQARAQQAEAAGQPEEAASLRQQSERVQKLVASLQLAKQQRQALLLQVRELKPVRMQISASAAASAAAGQGERHDEAAAAAEEVQVPEALQGELGATAPAAAVEAKGAELDQQLFEAQQEAAELQQHLMQTVLLEQQVQQAAQQQQVLVAQLSALQQQEGEGAQEQQVEQLRLQLAAAQQQKKAAQKQLWQVTELQELLQQAEGDRRRLQAALQQANPQVDPAELAQLHAELADADQLSSELHAELDSLQPAEQSASLAPRVGGPGRGDLDERLAKAEAETQRLRQLLADLQPIRMQLQLQEGANLAGAGAPGSVDFDSRPSSATAPAASRRSTRRSLDASPAAAEMQLLPREASDSSLVTYTSEQATALSHERAAADAAWREHQKNSDVPSLMRAKAELETRCEMLDAQLAKMQGELAKADEANAVFENHLESAIKTGDVSTLDGLRDKLESGKQSLSKRMFKRQPKGAPSPSKDSLRNTVHEMQDALTASEEEKNALKRQLAKLSKKYQQVTQQAAHTAGIVAGAQAMRRQSSESTDGEAAVVVNGHDDGDNELEMLKMREENEMLMEHVVMVKVRQAELEGEYLEAKRQLLRIREKNLQLARKLADLRDAAERGDPLPLTPRHSASSHVTPSATPGRQPTTSGAGDTPAPAGGGSSRGATPRSDRKITMPLGLRLPGF